MCHSGYTGDGITCAGTPCQINNGECDWHVTCGSSNGIKTCGDCPTGFSGTGDSKCVALCGNGSCDTRLGENCVSCPLDCFDTTCGMCGDGYCNISSESCQNCFEDCHSTCVSSCISCSKHGNCVLGSCICSAPWTGPSCDDMSETFTVAPNTTSSGITIAPTKALSNPANVSFSIFLQNLRELDQYGAEVSSLNVTEIGFSLVHTPPSNVSNNEMWEFFTTLDSRANLSIIFIQFRDPATEYTFHNKSKLYYANTLKMNVRISNWPFKSLSDTLEVIINIMGNGTGAQCSNVHSNGPTLSWTLLSSDGVSLYTQFETDSYIDGRERTITFTSLGQFSIAAQFPHFWTYAELDPNFAVIVDFDTKTSACEGTTKKNPIRKITIIVVVVSIVTVALIILVLGSVYTHRRRKNTRKQLQRALIKSS
eukprot:Phypoly_transcript_08284.p1 GENE.Phypoly_transcript_08284~~Phypoly_transcript_08284.p1  ORF type:complete len:424 (+),score=25.25 Phypoly_transcript_08284:152-1423(+)